MDPVKLGVIGCGVIGQQHLKLATASPLINVVTVADIREEAARESAQRFNVETVYNNADALIADPDVEAVVLAMPTCGRTELALKAFAQGKHVLIEKPVAMNAGDVERMILARGNLTAACCSSRRSLRESVRAASKFVASGALGELRVVRCRAISPAGKPPASSPPAWRLIKSLNGGGILVNWGCYDLDYLFAVTGWILKPRLVLAHTWPVASPFESYVAPGSDAETHFAALICCEGGSVITFERGEYVPGRPEGAWDLIGSKGTLHLALTSDAEIVFDHVIGEQGLVSEIIWPEKEACSTNDAAPALLASPIEDFAAAIREHRPPMTGLEQSLVIQKIFDAIYASAERCEAVAID